MASCLIGLGANLDDPQQALRAALQQLDDQPHVRVVAHSAAIQTRPIGPPQQPAYCNAAALLETSLPAPRLLRTMHDIESALGRRREQETRWGPRAIDLDLLLFDDLVCHDESLTAPHPWMLVRRFVMTGAAEVAPQWIHPLVKQPLGELLAALDASPAWIAVCGGDPTLRRAVAAQSQREILARDPSAKVAPLEEPPSELAEDADPPPAAVVLLGSLPEIYGGRRSAAAQAALDRGRPLLIAPLEVDAAVESVGHVWSGLQRPA